MAEVLVSIYYQKHKYKIEKWLYKEPIQTKHKWLVPLWIYGYVYNCTI